MERLCWSLTAMIYLCHPGSDLILSLTGSDAFRMICRLDLGMAETAPTAIVSSDLIGA